MTIEFKDVSFSRDKTVILQHINLLIKKGEFIGIFGPNGGGKTTFLKLLLGLLKPTHGSIKIFGESPESARSRMGYVPQAKLFDLQFPISVLEVVLMGLLSKKNDKKAKEKARSALARVNLLDKESKPFGTLSGGQAQRVLIARALVGDPEILLLDEATVSIDADAEKTIYELLTELKGKITILMVTHDLQPILEKAERLLCIQQTLSVYLPQDVCKHFALGLYHPPIKIL
ncbi:MAG TPA: ABC transporter ATP-binding protein [Rhabdochlamydiaceae bacterium]|nr:ABC transporter ATP-binding protein [Rhabdochlamydiaceae bacterium]